MTNGSSSYPCPACVGTMPPGTGWMSLEKMLEKGSGKVYQPYSGAVGLGMQEPPGNWYECWRCKGTGMVTERRKGDGRRRGDGVNLQEVSRRIRAETNLKYAQQRITELEAHDGV